MVALKVNTFGGMIPARERLLLPDGAAQLSQNTWLYSGAVEPFRIPTQIRTMASAASTKAHRVPRTDPTRQGLLDSDWLEFQNPNTDVLSSPVANDAFDRFYWASSSTIPYYNTKARIAAAQAPYKLGIPAPETAPGLSVAGGSGTTITRAYVYTFESGFGEEGPPSPPVLVTGFINGTWNVTAAVPTVDQSTGRNLTKINIYRTVTSSAGIATYYFVTVLTLPTVAYADTLADSVVVANNQLQSTGYTPPPADLQGLVAMPNGMFVGWRGNELWFSEPYKPHAWPVAYTNAVDYDIVGLGVLGQTCVVCTTSSPYAATGVNPSSISLSKMATIEPCVARLSIVSTKRGVYYASPNGIVLVNPGGAEVVTRDLISKDHWQQSLTIELIRAAWLGTAYYCFGARKPAVFQPGAFETTAFEQEDFTGAYNGAAIDFEDARVAYNQLYDAMPTDNVYTDPWSGEVLMVRDGKLYFLDITDNAEPGTYVWKSKRLQLAAGANLGVIQVFVCSCNVDGWMPPLNPVPNAALVQTLAADQWGLIRVYADNRHVFTREIRANGEIMRLPSGFQATMWEFEIEARIKVTGIQLASTVGELSRV